MIAYFFVVACGLIYVGGAFFELQFGLSLFASGLGGLILALIFATQQRLLTDATRPKSAAEHYSAYIKQTWADSQNWSDDTDA